MNSDKNDQKKVKNMMALTKLMAAIDKMEQSFEYRYFQLYPLRQKIYIICGVSTWLPIAFSLFAVPLLFCMNLQLLKNCIGIALFWLGLQWVFLSLLALVHSCTMYPKLLRINILSYLPSKLEFFTMGISILLVSIFLLKNKSNFNIPAISIILHLSLCYSCMWLCISLNFYKLGQKHNKTQNSRLPWFSNFYLRFVAAVTMPPFLVTRKTFNMNRSVDSVLEDSEEHNFLPYTTIDANDHLLFIDYKEKIYLNQRETSVTQVQPACLSLHLLENNTLSNHFKKNQSPFMFFFDFFRKVSCQRFYYRFHSFTTNSFFLSACGSTLITFLTLFLCIDIWFPKIFSFHFLHRYIIYSLINTYSLSNKIQSPHFSSSFNGFSSTASQSVLFFCWVFFYALGILLLTNSGVMIFGQWIDFILFGSLSMLNRNQLFDLKYPDHNLLLDLYKMTFDQVQQAQFFFDKVLHDPTRTYCTPNFADCHKQVNNVKS
ncbi:uncharacterized protein LOC128883863 isoform X2 [Hylaeus volcanicus]|uniref:uncharacterized protein LOC128883863 isoform X2 n=1 Tax=Hylaeus volcanicus TaxID=313075 RepID=UPI0023B86A2F|nr:uncharacterized protein LOC128883863 isoform X2 [Hylaeus volcanicus]